MTRKMMSLSMKRLVRRVNASVKATSMIPARRRTMMMTKKRLAGYVHN
jgi:hypothetical protein